MKTVTMTIIDYKEFEELTLRLGIVGYDFVGFMEANGWVSYNFFVDAESIERAKRQESKIISRTLPWFDYVNSVLALLVGRGILSGENFCITVN